MPGWSWTRYEEELRELFARVEESGVEEAVGAFATTLLAEYPPEAVAAHAGSLRAKRRIKGSDAMAAFRLHEAHILARVPLPIRLVWAITKRVLSSWVTSSSSERVVIRTPSATGRILCPVLKAADGDLARARPVCEALFRHDAFTEPMAILVAKAASPRIRWEIDEYRERPDFPCYYAIALSEEG